MFYVVFNLPSTTATDQLNLFTCRPSDPLTLKPSDFQTFWPSVPLTLWPSDSDYQTLWPSDLLTILTDPQTMISRGGFILPLARSNEAETFVTKCMVIVVCCAAVLAVLTGTISDCGALGSASMFAQNWCASHTIPWAAMPGSTPASCKPESSSVPWSSHKLSALAAGLSPRLMFFFCFLFESDTLVDPCCLSHFTHFTPYPPMLLADDRVGLIETDTHCV